MIFSFIRAFRVVRRTAGVSQKSSPLLPGTCIVEDTDTLQRSSVVLKWPFLQPVTGNLELWERHSRGL